MNEIIDRAQPLIDAIQHYAKDMGHPPPTLDDLVPKYIAAIPGTGLDICPSYLYSVDMKSGRWSISVKLGAIGFRHIAYSPSNDYSITVTPLRNGWILADP